MVKRKLSKYNVFTQKCMKAGRSMGECAVAWKKSGRCATCAPRGNPGKKTIPVKKTKTSKKSTRKVYAAKSSIAPFIIGAAVGGGVSFGSRYIDRDLPLPYPLNRLSTAVPIGLAAVGVIGLFTQYKAAAIGLLLGSTATLIYNLFISPVGLSARRGALRRRIIARAPKRLTALPVPTHAVPPVTGRPGANGSDQRPIPAGLPLTVSNAGGLPIKSANILKAAHPETDNRQFLEARDLPVRLPNHPERIQTFESGERVLF